MPILTGDIKILASAVMDDVPEGGGAPTATAIVDGTSNAIVPDVSELDRAGGRVNLRKLFVSVQTDDVATYMGSNVIVAEPPNDPNISLTLFTTNSVFDTRSEASARVESYLNRGGLWPGFLYNDHIAGQRIIQIAQRPEADAIPVGHTLVLVKNEGLAGEVSQYVRTTSVSSVITLFYDASTQKTFNVAVVSCGISDALRSDFPGSVPTISFAAGATATKVRDTTVADAGTYVGVSALASAASLGDFTINAESVYTQLVPSAQTETPISDVRTNGLSTALVATGGPITQTINTLFTTASNLFSGGPIYPGSLSIVRSGVTVIDVGGLLKSAGVEVGQVDYDNGILTLSTNVFGAGSGSHSVTFTPATVPDLISDQRAIRITQENRSLSYVWTMNDVPVARTLSVSYLAQGRWYVLRDDGAGKLSGISSAYGVGTISYTTGSVSVTLGALPDAGSSIVIQSYSAVATVAANNTLLHSDKVYVPINSDGQISEEKGSKAIGVGTLTITWNSGGSKTAYDDGLGTLTGDATGTVDYANGVVRLSPNTLPPAGTIYTLATSVPGKETSLSARLYNANPPTTILPGSPGFTTPATTTRTMVTPSSSATIYPTPGTVSIARTANILYRVHLEPNGFLAPAPSYLSRPVSVVIQDDGQGTLFVMLEGVKVVVGAVDYASAAFSGLPHFPLTTADPHGPTLLASDGYASTWNDWVALGHGSGRYLYLWDGNIPRFATTTATAPAVYEDVAVAAVTVAPTNPTVVTAPQMPAPATVTLASAAVSQYLARTVTVPNYTLKGVGFVLGGARYQQLTDGTLLKDIVPTTGGGTPAGSVAGALGAVFISAWPANASPVLSDWRGLIAPPSVGTEAPFSAFSSTFRIASSPIRPGSLSILGTMQDGTTINVTADATGKINGTRVKGRVDYQYGLVELYFVNPLGNTELNTDLSFLQIAGLTTTPADLVMLNSLRYNAVAYSYLPLDASILGIDPVRLPSDGRVPIFRAGGFAVVGHTGKITATVSNGQTVNCARVRLSRVRVIGNNGTVINAGYSADLEAGTVTFSSVAGYSQPVTIEHRIEDMAVVNDVQISGELTFTRPLTHDYPVGAYVSSALVAGDLKARVSTLFDQTTWANLWADVVSGTSATGTYNATLAPVVVTNRGALTERWALVFTNTTSFQVIGEHVGVIGTGTINADCAPINPATGVPYFTLAALGWGSGWAASNVLRLNTIGAMAPFWVVRTIQQGPNTGTEHSFTLLSRGDVDRA